MVVTVLFEKIVSIYTWDILFCFFNKRFKGKEQQLFCITSKMDK